MLSFVNVFNKKFYAKISFFWDVTLARPTYQYLLSYVVDRMSVHHVLSIFRVGWWTDAGYCTADCLRDTVLCSWFDTVFRSLLLVY